MKAQELRIGNYILKLSWDEDAGGNIVGDPEGNEIIEVTPELMINMIAPGAITQYDPITITEEWLMRFGFEKITAKTRQRECEVFVRRDKPYHVLGFFLRCEVWRATGEDWERWICGQHDDRDNTIIDYYMAANNLNFVHQLQNLYFALTGQELTLKQ